MGPLIQNFKIFPPRANTWHLTITCARGVGNLTCRAFPREGNLTFSRVGWGIWTKSVKFNLLSSFLCQTTLFQRNIFLVAKWRSTRKCQRNDVKMRLNNFAPPPASQWPHASCALFPFGQQEMEITYYVCVTVLHLWEKFLPCRTRLYERVCYRDLRDNFYKCSYCSWTLKQQLHL